MEVEDPSTEEILHFIVITCKQLLELKEKPLSDCTDPATATELQSNCLKRKSTRLRV